MGTVIACVVMYVQDAVHAIVDNIIDNFLHAFHPSLVNLTVTIHLLIPCNRYTDSTEPSLFHHLDQFWLGYRLPPTGLMLLCCSPCLAGVVSIERIT